MSAVIVQVADAICRQLKEQEWLKSWCVERTYSDCQLELEATKDLRIDIVPGEYQAVELGTRDDSNYIMGIDVVLRQHLVHNNEAEQIDALIKLVERIHDYFAGGRLAYLPEAAWIKTRITLPYHPRHLVDWHQFTAALRLWFSVSVELEG